MIPTIISQQEESLAINGSIVIVGAGIIGLDVAFALSERGFGPSITVIAEYLPGDTAPLYTSLWAGCNYSGVSGSSENQLRWDRMGYSHLAKLAVEKGHDAYVVRTPSIEFWDEGIPGNKLDDIRDYLEDFVVLPTESLPDGVKSGISFTTLTINAPKHLEFLVQSLKNLGVTFVRQKLSHIHTPFGSKETKLAFNCTGNASQQLLGVGDSKCYPTRGQVVHVKAPHIKYNIMRHGKDYFTHVIPRPISDGTVILGGSRHPANSDINAYFDETESILARTRQLCKELDQQPFEVLGAFAGLRPSRQGGPRIEREEIIVNDVKRLLIHNYGADGTGFQAGYGMATDAVNKAEDMLSEILATTSSNIDDHMKV
ncbi:FAD dependent oxidoreductase [Trichoderma afarasin]